MITIHYNSLRALVKASFENNIKDNELKENEIAAYFIIWYKPKNGKRKAKHIHIYFKKVDEISTNILKN